MRHIVIHFRKYIGSSIQFMNSSPSNLLSGSWLNKDLNQKTIDTTIAFYVRIRNNQNPWKLRIESWNCAYGWMCVCVCMCDSVLYLCFCTLCTSFASITILWFYLFNKSKNSEWVSRIAIRIKHKTKATREEEEEKTHTHSYILAWTISEWKWDTNRTTTL